MSLLEIDGVSVRFSAGSGVQAVEDVSLRVAPGEKMTVVGETGSGKSVLLLAIVQLLPKGASVSGSIRFEGEELIGCPRRRLDTLRGGQISYVPQGSGNGMNPLLTVGFQVCEPLMEHKGLPRRHAAARAVALLRRFHLGREEALARSHPHTLSGGMRQRALLAMGISAGPRLILADEPTKGLDQTRIGQVISCFQSLAGQAILCVTHDLNFARRISDRIGVLYASGLLEEAPTEALFTRPLHPYTRALIAALPENGLRFDPGFAPAHDDGAYRSGCRYLSRCPHAGPRCHETPPMTDLGNHLVRCWLYADAN
jgi:peptide/nickel transport system ATP-binding protein